MKLGGSLERRRRGRTPRPPREEGRGGTRWDDFVGMLRVVGLTVLLGFVGFGIGYLVATFVIFPAPDAPPDLVEVPDLLRADVREARQRVRESGLHFGAVDSLRHPTAEAGRVLGQSPLPGQLSLPDDTVRVTVSVGAQTREVPAVEGLRGDEVVAILQATGFEVRIDTVESDLPRGRVVELDPPSGTPLILPGRVEITVSEGPSRIEMPYVLGMPRDEASALLDSLGLVISEVTETNRPGRGAGRVVEQEPASGTLVERGSAVRLVVIPEGRRGRNFPPPGPYDPGPVREVSSTLQVHRP